MKRAASRASKMSTDGQEAQEVPAPGIPDGKWREFLEREETEMFILGLREEIVRNCLRICYEKYMENQAIAFTVHCAYLAWVKVIDVYYMFRDPGDNDDPEVKESWEPDEEPQPSVIDSWASDCIKASPEEDQTTGRTLTSRCKRESSRDLESLESCSFISDFFEGEGGELGFLDLFKKPSSLYSTAKKSIFTRTLSMSRESLPLGEPLVLFGGPCYHATNTPETEKSRKRNVSEVSGQSKR